MRKSVVKLRAQKMLDSDRLGLSSDAENIIRRDLEDVLREYFVLKRSPDVVIDGDKTCIEIKISAIAKSVKNFNILK